MTDYSIYKSVVSYSRFSSADQASGDSLRRQNQQVEGFCLKHQLTLHNLSFHDAGKSAFKGDHLSEDGQLQAFIQAIKDKRIITPCLLLVERLDRLSRLNPTSALALLTSLVNLGVSIQLLDGSAPVSLASLNENPYELMKLLLMASSSYDESNRKQYRANENWKNKRSKISAGQLLTGKIPNWLNIVDGKLEKDPEKAKIINLIFDLYITEGMGRSQIAKHLNSKKIKTLSKLRKADVMIKASTSWSESRISQLLRNRALIGEFQPMTAGETERIKAGPAIPNYYPSVVDIDTFNRAQYVRLKRPATKAQKGFTYKNLFTGIAVCSHCNTNLVCVDKGKRSSGPALVCGNAQRGLGCKYISYNLAVIEKAVLMAIRTLDLSSVFNRTSKTNTTNIIASIEAIKGKILELDRKSKNIRNAIASIGLDDDLQADYDEIKSTMNSSKLELESLELELQEASTSSTDYKQIKSLISNSFDTTDSKDIRRRLSLWLRQQKISITIGVYEFPLPVVVALSIGDVRVFMFGDRQLRQLNTTWAYDYMGDLMDGLGYIIEDGKRYDTASNREVLQVVRQGRQVNYTLWDEELWLKHHGMKPNDIHTHFKMP